MQVKIWSPTCLNTHAWNNNTVTAHNGVMKLKLKCPSFNTAVVLLRSCWCTGSGG